MVDAVWRVIVRDGLDRASVRTVAQEAGLSTGSLRHYFQTQDELLLHALTAAGDRLDARLTATGTTGPARERVLAKLEQMLPLDLDRRRECEVWLAFTARALTDESIQDTQREISKRLDQAFRYLVGLLVEDGSLLPGLDPRVEAVRLQSLVDGLILRGLASPRSRPGGRTIVGAHLDQITTGRPDLT